MAILKPLHAPFEVLHRVQQQHSSAPPTVLFYCCTVAQTWRLTEEVWAIQKGDVTYLEELGTGGWGTVHRGKWADTEVRVCVVLCRGGRDVGPSSPFDHGRGPTPRCVWDGEGGGRLSCISTFR